MFIGALLFLLVSASFCNVFAQSVTSLPTNRQSIFVGAASVAQNTTNYLVPGLGSGVGNLTVGSASQAATAPYAMTLRNLRVNQITAPASGQTATYTIYTGTAAGQAASASTITCQIVNSSNPVQCSDLTHSVAVPAGGIWGLQVATSATSGATGIITWSIEQDAP